MSPPIGKGLFKMKNQSVQYPNISSATHSVFHGEGLPAMQRNRFHLSQMRKCEDEEENED